MNYRVDCQQKVVTVPGTPEAVKATQCFSRSRVVIRALQSNAGAVYYGGPAMDATHRQTLQPGQADSIELMGVGYFDLTKLYVDAENAGEGVEITYSVRA
jgi:hypothetical protein